MVYIWIKYVDSYFQKEKHRNSIYETETLD